MRGNDSNFKCQGTTDTLDSRHSYHLDYTIFVVFEFFYAVVVLVRLRTRYDTTRECDEMAHREVCWYHSLLVSYDMHVCVNHVIVITSM